MNQKKKTRSRDENQQQTQPTYDAGSGIATQATLVGNERSHHCVTPAPFSESQDISHESMPSQILS